MDETFRIMTCRNDATIHSARFPQKRILIIIIFVVNYSYIYNYIMPIINVLIFKATLNILIIIIPHIIMLIIGLMSNTATL